MVVIYISLVGCFYKGSLTSRNFSDLWLCKSNRRQHGALRYKSRLCQALQSAYVCLDCDTTWHLNSRRNSWGNESLKSRCKLPATQLWCLQPAQMKPIIPLFLQSLTRMCILNELWKHLSFFFFFTPADQNLPLRRSLHLWPPGSLGWIPRMDGGI